LYEIKDIIACSKITEGIVAAKVNLTVVAPDAKVLMMEIKFVTLAKRAVSAGALS
jgi:hypothetical protein